MHGLIVPEVQEAEVTNGRKCSNLMASTAHAHSCKCFICSWIQDLTLHRHYWIQSIEGTSPYSMTQTLHLKMKSGFGNEMIKDDIFWDHGFRYFSINFTCGVYDYY